jgi:hypothetical protein
MRSVSPLVALLVSWIPQTFIQLVLLPIIMVGGHFLTQKKPCVEEFLS